MMFGGNHSEEKYIAFAQDLAGKLEDEIGGSCQVLVNQYHKHMNGVDGNEHEMDII